MPALPDLRTDYLAIARQFADRPNDWPLAPRFNPDKRWYHRIAAAEDAEVWLLTWLPGQATDLHDHGGSAGAFVIVSGVLTEYTLTADTTPSTPAGVTRLVPTPLPASAGRRFDADHVHQLRNEGDRPAVSVHAYGPALTSMTRYRLDGGRLQVAAVDRAGVQW